MASRATNLKMAVSLAALLLSSATCRSEGIDTEHMFGFTIGSDVGETGEMEIQARTTGRFGKQSGTYSAASQELALEIVPVPDFRAEFGAVLAFHNINGVIGLEDRRQAGFQGASLDLRYRFLDRRTATFGLTLAGETHADRLDEVSGERVRKYGTDLALAFDKELIPDRLVAALNVLYQPEWTQSVVAGAVQQEATVGLATAVMMQLKPGVFLGGEARYLRKYEGLALDSFVGHALFVGPTVFIRLSERSRLTLAWSAQVAGRTEVAGRSSPESGSLDVVNFERHQARLQFGVSF